MASNYFFIALAIVATIVVAPTRATEFVVGDEIGWTTNFDYQAWAQDKEFHVGDKLIFNYPRGNHNVHRVDGNAFQQCSPPATSEALITGNDVITLTSQGRKWYICGVGSHCESGNQKLVITVLPQVESPAASPSPASNPPSAATGVAPMEYLAVVLSALSVFMMFLA